MINDLINDLWSMINDQWSMINNQWSMITDQWSINSDEWSLIIDEWSLIIDQWSMINDQWPMINKQCPIINDHSSTINDQQQRFATAGVGGRKAKAEVSINSIVYIARYTFSADRDASWNRRQLAWLVTCSSSLAALPFSAISCRSWITSRARDSAKRPRRAALLSSPDARCFTNS